MRLRVLLLLFLTLAAACGPKSMKQRMRDSERLADKTTAALDDAERFAGEFEPDKMDKSLAEAQSYLMDKDIELYPEAGMLGDRMVELRNQAAGVRAERERLDLEKKMNAAREKIVPRMTALREALDGLVPDAPTSAQVEAVEKAVQRAREDLEAVKELLSKNADFAAWAKGQKLKAERAMEAVKPAKKKVKFLEGPVAARTEGAKVWKQAKRAKDEEERLKLAQEASEKFAACAKEGDKLVKDEELATASIVLSGKPTAPITVVSGCKDDLEGVKTEIARLKELTAKKKPAETKKKKKK